MELFFKIINSDIVNYVKNDKRMDKRIENDSDIVIIMVTKMDTIMMMMLVTKKNQKRK